VPADYSTDNARAQLVGVRECAWRARMRAKRGHVRSLHDLRPGVPALRDSAVTVSGLSFYPARMPDRRNATPVGVLDSGFMDQRR
jgi:hypothetical protein